MSDLVLLIWLLIGLVGVELARPFFKSIRDVAGILLFPLLAFCLLIVGYYVYGFRPELVPLGIFIFFVSIIRMPKLVSLLQRLRVEDDKAPSLVAFIFGFLFLLTTGIIAIGYSPSKEYLSEKKSGAEFETTIWKDASGGNEYFIRIYRGASEKPRGTILVIPPVSGSVEVVSSVCELLHSNGFSVITLSQPGLDMPAYDVLNKPVAPSIKKATAYIFSFIAGLNYKTPNEYGRAVERERLQALESVISHGDYPQPLYIVGYGAGGAAAITYATQHVESPIAALINIEGPLFSALEFPEHEEPVRGIQGFLQKITPRSVHHIGAVPVLHKPLLVLVSDTVTETKQRDSRYATLVRAIHQAQAPAILAALTGAGPFDYSDVTINYPLYSALMGGKGNKVRSPGYYVESTAALMYNFICSIEKLQTNPEASSDCPPIPVSGDVYLEYNGYDKNYNQKEVLGK